MSEINKTELEKSPYFCMLPWTHIHFWPDSSAHYCCISDTDKPIGHYEGDLKKIVNAENIKRVRNNMLSGQPSPECQRCYDLEKNGIYSLRNNSNKKYFRYFGDVEKTNPDGSVNSFQMRYLDIRFSNLCNFRCRSCGPNLSSAWYAEQIKMFPQYAAKPQHLNIATQEQFWTDILPHLDTIEEAYFAGGEPLVTDEVYKVLDHWLASGLVDMEINFTTNFSRLSHKGKNFLDYLKHFPMATVSASLDDSGTRGEYMRKGTNWSQIVENRKKMIQECPYTAFEITPTISVFNVWHFPEFHYEWLKKGLLDSEGIRLNILTAPPEMSIDIIAPEKRQRIKEKWQDYLSMIRTECKMATNTFSKSIESYNAVLSALEKNPHRELRDVFIERNNTIDQLRGESLYEVFPELKELL